MIEIDTIDELVIGTETRSLPFGVKISHVKKLVICSKCEQKNFDVESQRKNEENPNLPKTGICDQPTLKEVKINLSDQPTLKEGSPAQISLLDIKRLKIFSLCYGPTEIMNILGGFGKITSIRTEGSGTMTVTYDDHRDASEALKHAKKIFNVAELY